MSINSPNIQHFQNHQITKQKQNIDSKSKISFANKETKFRNPIINHKLAMIYFGGKNIIPAKRLSQSNYAISAYINEINKARWLYGDKSVVDMAMGNPDLLPPERAREALKRKVNNLWSHRYNNPKGERSFLHEVSIWMKNRFDVAINPRTEVMATSGSSDAVDHIFTAYANKGDKILIANPGYALYDDLIARHDLKSAEYKLKPENNYLPDFKEIAKEHPDAKIMLINYPHNPTGSFAPKHVFEDAVKFAKENGILLIHDMDNSEVSHTGQKPIGIMEIEGAKDVAFQVHTFSKAQSMPGLRIAFVTSNKEFVDNLFQAKLLSGGSVYTPVQAAGTEALRDSDHYIEKVNDVYRSRKNTTVERLHQLGSKIKPSDGTYYLWQQVPPGFTSEEFYKYILHKANVAFTPGTVFGKNGEGFVRIVMSAGKDSINKSFDKIEKAGIRFDTPKHKLPIETQEEIRRIAAGEIDVRPKSEQDFEEYKDKLNQRKQELETRLKDKAPKLKAYIPKEDAIQELPIYLFKDGQSVYLQNEKEGKSVFGEAKDILPFSPDSDYNEINSMIKKDWLPYMRKENNNKAEILTAYQVGKFYPDATYFSIVADNKLQVIANLEVQNDGDMWVRSLNSAPWNQGKYPHVRGSGTALMARMMSHCLETGSKVIKLATDKTENVLFYSHLGFKEIGKKEYDGIPHTVMSIDKTGMKEFLHEYQANLSY